MDSKNFTTTDPLIASTVTAQAYLMKYSTAIRMKLFWCETGDMGLSPSIPICLDLTWIIDVGIWNEVGLAVS